MNSGELANWIGVAIAFFALILFIVAERDKFLPFFKRHPINPASGQNAIISPAKHETVRAVIYTRILLGIIFSFALTQAIFWIYDNGYIIYTWFDKSKELMLSAGISFFISLLFTFIYIDNSRRPIIFYVHFFERFVIAFSLIYLMTYSFYVMYFVDGGHEVTYDMGYIFILGVILIFLISFAYTPMDLLSLFIRNIITRIRKTTPENSHIEQLPKSK